MGNKKSLINHGLLKSMEIFIVSSSGVELNPRIQTLLRTLFYSTFLEN